MTQDVSLTHEIWNGWHRQHVRAIVHPATEAEVLTEVVQARQRGGHVKAIGGRHSFNNISFTGANDSGGDTVLNLHQLARVLHVDRTTGLVRVQAGISLWKLVPILAYHGLALPNIGAWMAQTLAGVLATGTHGSGGRHRQSLLGAFREVRIVDGTGVARPLTAHEMSFLNLGCFGVVTEVTLACVPLYQCERRKKKVAVDGAVDEIHEQLQQHDFVDLRWTGRNRMGLLTTWEINTRPSTKLDRIRSWIEGYLLGAVNLAITHYPYDYVPQPVTNAVLAGFGLAYTQAAFTGPQNEIWYRSLTFNSRAPIAPHDEYEFAVPMDRAAACVHAVRQVLAGTSASAGSEFQLRFEGPASVRLAPNVGIETMWFDFNLFDREGTRELGKRLAAVVLDFGGRPHWSKHIPDVGFCARAAYGDTLDAWEATRRRCDPDGLFVNSWYHRYIAPKLGSPAGSC